jgi:hypothetical protein
MIMVVNALTTHYLESTFKLNNCNKLWFEFVFEFEAVLPCLHIPLGCAFVVNFAAKSLNASFGS